MGIGTISVLLLACIQSLIESSLLSHCPFSVPVLLIVIPSRTLSEIKGPILVFFECRNEFQELEFFTKAYTILDGKMMLSEIEVLQY